MIRNRSIKQSYETYRGGIDYETYKKVLTFYFKYLAQGLLNANVYKLPNNTGIIGIFKRPTYGKGLFDYNLYKESGIKSWKKNFHSYKYAANFKWDPRGKFSSLPSFVKTTYKFSAVRDLKRLLAKKINTENIIETFYDLN